MKELPKKWCVKDCAIVSKWASDVFLCADTVSTNYLHINMNLFPEKESYAFEDRIQVGFTKITLEDFKELVLKQPKEIMTKQDFTIEGSETLKKAFVEECGIKLIANYTFEQLTYKYLAPTTNRKTIQSQQSKNSKHFILPSQWEEALQYVKEYFAEDEFKIGDKVIILNNNHGGKLLIGSVGTITSNGHSPEFGIKGTMKSGKTDIWYYSGKGDIRKATSEEIQAAQSKLFKLGEFTAVVTKDKVEIAGRGSLTHDECIELVELLQSTVNIGDFDVTYSVNTVNIGCVKNVPFADMLLIYAHIKGIEVDDEF